MRKPDAKTAFQIGWDYYAYGLSIPSNYANFEDLKQGFNEAKKRKITQQKEDRFVRKWLHLRLGAWKRSRIFSMSITPEVIRFIDKKRCPITNDLLTHGERKDTDWSVDRVNNDRAYALGNILVVSTRANVYKGNHSFLDIYRFAYDDTAQLPDPIDGMKPLTRYEWAKWVFMCQLSEDNEFEPGFVPVPCVTDNSQGLHRTVAAILQMAIADKALGYSSLMYNEISEVLSKNHRREMADLSKRYSNNRFNIQYYLDGWFNLPLFKRFLRFYESLGMDEKKLIHAKIYQRYSTGMYVSMSENDLGADSNGFVRSQ